MDIKSIKDIWAAFQEVQEKKLSPAQKKHFDKDNDGDIDDADMAMLNKKKKTEAKTECPKCDGKGCDHCDNKGYHTEEAPADPVKKAPARKGDKANADAAPKKVAEEAEVEEFLESLSEEQLDELSKNLLTRYKKKADAQTTDHMKKFDHGGKKPSAASTANFNKRHAGSNTADDKIKGKYVKVPATVKKEEAELEEAKMGDSGWKKSEVHKDAQGNVIKTKNVAKHLAKKGAAQASSLKKEEADWLADLAAKLDEIEQLSEKKDKHTKGATEPEGLLDKESPKSKEFVDQHKVDNTYTDFEEKGHEDASKAGKATKQSPARRGDQLNAGDKKPVK